MKNESILTSLVVLCVIFIDLCFPIVIFLLAIVLSVLFQFTDSDDPFGIFKLFVAENIDMKHITAKW